MVVKNGYIVAVEHGDREYDSVNELIHSMPKAPDGYQFKLRVDNLEWELVELPPIEETDNEATADDYEQALESLGVKLHDES